jgi:hypothetical protein
VSSLRVLREPPSEQKKMVHKEDKETTQRTGREDTKHIKGKEFYDL